MTFLKWQTSVSIEKHRFHEHTVLPLTALTQFEVGRIALCGMEGRITQDDHASIDLANQPLKGVIRHIGRGTVPPHHQAILVHQQAEFAPDNPAMVGQAFATNLLGLRPSRMGWISSMP